MNVKINFIKRIVILIVIFLHPFLAESRDYSLYVGNYEFNSDFSLVTETRVLRVNPDTGDRSLVSSNTKGSGPLLYGIHDLIYCGSNSLYVMGTNGLAFPDTREMLYRVDLSSGNRTAVAGPFTGTTRRMLLSSDGNIICIRTPAETSANNIDKIDPSTANTSTLASASIGSGIAYSNSYDAVEESPSSIIYGKSSQIARLNTITLERIAIATFSSGSIGPMTYLPGKLLVIRSMLDQTKQIAEIDLPSLNISVLGPSADDLILDSQFIAHRILQAPDNIIYFSSAPGRHSGGALLLAVCKIDRSTGRGSIVSGPANGSGPILGNSEPPVVNGPIGLAIAPNVKSSAKQWTKWNTP